MQVLCTRKLNTAVHVKHKIHVMQNVMQIKAQIATEGIQ